MRDERNTGYFFLQIMNPNTTPKPTAEQRPTPLFGTVEYMDAVDLILESSGLRVKRFPCMNPETLSLTPPRLAIVVESLNGKPAKDPLLFIPDEADVCAVASHAALERRNAELAEALAAYVKLHYDHRQHDRGSNLSAYKDWLEESEDTFIAATAALESAKEAK